MIQTLALFRAAYRELNARKLFWITLVISALLVIVFFMVGVHPNGLSFLWWEFEVPILNSQLFPPDVFYKQLFALVGVPYWLAWLATILALVSTAPIIPDMVSGGSIDVLLSKPIGRTRLFLTRYCTALLFVIAQVSVFTFGCFLLIGLRGGVWEPWVLIAIPLVVLFFSYLYCVCALVGFLTRSTIASLLITILFWMAIFGVNSAEGISLVGRVSSQISVEDAQRQLDEAVKMDDPIEVTEPLTEELNKEEAARDVWARIHAGFYWAKVVLPKTDDTIALLERVLRQRAGMEGFDDGMDDNIEIMGSRRISRREFAERLQAEVDSRSVFWIIGTSLIFEFLVLALTCWRFSRRDF